MRLRTALAISLSVFLFAPAALAQDVLIIGDGDADFTVRDALVAAGYVVTISADRENV